MEDDRLAGGKQGAIEVPLLGRTGTTSHGFHEGKPPLKEVWLLVEWPASEQEPTKYFFCDLPADYSLRRLVRLTKCRWKIEQDYQQLKEELGLDHYEGRSWQGWHHHVTLVMMAHAFLTLETLRGKKNFWVDPAEDAT
jgi:SRSO17 transposase